MTNVRPRDLARVAARRATRPIWRVQSAALTSARTAHMDRARFRPTCLRHWLDGRVLLLRCRPIQQSSEMYCEWSDINSGGCLVSTVTLFVNCRARHEVDVTPSSSYIKPIPPESAGLLSTRLRSQLFSSSLHFAFCLRTIPTAFELWPRVQAGLCSATSG